MHLDSYNRALCSLQVEESADHLSLYSPFASSSWNLLNITILAQASFLDIVSYLEDQLNSIFFMNAIVLMCWTVWSARNDKIFQGLQENVQKSKMLLKKELSLLTLTVTSRKATPLSSWIQNLV